MITGSTKVVRKRKQRRWLKSVLTSLTCDYLTALVIFAAALAVKAAVLSLPFLPALPVGFSIADE